MKLETALAKLVVDNKQQPRKALAPSAFQGIWRNEYGSTADIQVKGASVSGTYTSKVSSTGQVAVGDITGFAKEDVISFSVLWNAPGASMTSWVGQIVDDKGTPTLKTLWHLVINIEDVNEPTGLWTSVLAGADDFQKA